MPELKLTWLKEHPQSYDLGECEFHLAFRADDFDEAHKKHEEMGCICFENHEMGIISSKTPTAIGLKFYREFHNNKTESESITLGYLIV